MFPKWSCCRKKYHTLFALEGEMLLSSRSFLKKLVLNDEKSLLKLKCKSNHQIKPHVKRCSVQTSRIYSTLNLGRLFRIAYYREISDILLNHIMCSYDGSYCLLNSWVTESENSKWWEKLSDTCQYPYSTGDERLIVITFGWLYPGKLISISVAVNSWFW